MALNLNEGLVTIMELILGVSYKDYHCHYCGRPCGRCGLKNHETACERHHKNGRQDFILWVAKTKERDKKKGRVW